MADTNFVGEGRELIVNKSSIIGTIGVEAEPVVKFLQIASVMSKDTFYAGVPGHHFVLTVRTPGQCTSLMGSRCARTSRRRATR